MWAGLVAGLLIAVVTVPVGVSGAVSGAVFLLRPAGGTLVSAHRGEERLGAQPWTPVPDRMPSTTSRSCERAVMPSLGNTR